jgi:hypothetical protein
VKREIAKGAALALPSFALSVLLGGLLARAQIVHAMEVVLLPRLDVFTISGAWVALLFVLGVGGCLLGVLRRSHDLLLRTALSAPAVALLVSLWAQSGPPHDHVDPRMVKMLAASAMAFWVTSLATLGHLFVASTTKRRPP